MIICEVGLVTSNNAQCFYMGTNTDKTCSETTDELAFNLSPMSLSSCLTEVGLKFNVSEAHISGGKYLSTSGLVGL